MTVYWSFDIEWLQIKKVPLQARLLILKFHIYKDGFSSSKFKAHLLVGQVRKMKLFGKDFFLTKVNKPKIILILVICLSIHIHIALQVIQPACFYFPFE